jgi:hypothetical protein
MLILELTLLLVAIGIAVMPCWNHSASWGYGPGACVGGFLVCLGIFAASGGGGPSEAMNERLAAQPRNDLRNDLMVEASIIYPAPPFIYLSAVE